MPAVREKLWRYADKEPGGWKRRNIFQRQYFDSQTFFSVFRKPTCQTFSRAFLFCCFFLFYSNFRVEKEIQLRIRDISLANFVLVPVVTFDCCRVVWTYDFRYVKRRELRIFHLAALSICETFMVTRGMRWRGWGEGRGGGGGRRTSTITYGLPEGWSMSRILSCEWLITKQRKLT